MGRGGGGSVEAQLREPSISISYLALFWMLWGGGGGMAQHQHVKLDLLDLVHPQIPQKSSFMIRSILPRFQLKIFECQISF